MRKLHVLAVCGIAIHAGSIGPAAGQARLWEEPGPCGRECLTGIVDSYLEALVAHDPAAAPLAGEAAFVENAERLPRELMHIFKIENKRIDEIEAMGVLLPYMSTNGWTDFLK